MDLARRDLDRDVGTRGGDGTTGLGSLARVDAGRHDRESGDRGHRREVRSGPEEAHGQVEPVRLANGLTGSRIAYVGLFGDVQTPVEGEITTVVSPLGTGVVFDGWAPNGQIRLALGDLHTMIETAEIA